MRGIGLCLLSRTVGHHMCMITYPKETYKLEWKWVGKLIVDKYLADMHQAGATFPKKPVEFWLHLVQ